MFCQFIFLHFLHYLDETKIIKSSVAFLKVGPTVLDQMEVQGGGRPVKHLYIIIPKETVHSFNIMVTLMHKYVSRT